MNNRELKGESQTTIKALIKTIEQQSATIQSLSNEVSQLRKLLLEKDKNAQKIVGKLNGLAKIVLPHKTEKRKIAECANPSITHQPPHPWSEVTMEQSAKYMRI